MEKKPSVTAYPDYDRTGRWVLHINKKRGKLTLQEVVEAARAYESDYYLLLLDCFHDGDDFQCYGDGQQTTGDHVVLYRTDLFYDET